MPPAFHLELSDVARLSLVVDPDDACATDVGLVAYDRNSRDHDDEDNYDILPNTNTLRPTKFEAGGPSPLNVDVDDLYDYLTTKTEAQLVSTPRSPALADDELYDFITPAHWPECRWSDGVVQRTSTIGPDVDDDDMYDYIGTHIDTEQQLKDPSIGGYTEEVVVDNVIEGRVYTDKLHRYPLFCSSHEDITLEAASCRSAAVLEHQLSSSSWSDHYDVLPGCRASSSDQLLVQECSTSESTSRSSALSTDSTDKDCYDFIIPKDKTGSAFLDTAVNSEEAGAARDHNEPVTAVNERKQSSSSDDHYDVLPCRSATYSDQLSVRKSSDAFRDSTTSTSASPMSCSTLSSSLPEQSSDQTQYINCDYKKTVTSSDVTRNTIVTPVILDQFYCRRSTENKQSSDSMFTAI